jgi:hypothetical protein
LGLHFRGKRVFGNNKTFRGLAVNVLFCIVGALIQTWLYRAAILPEWLPLLDYGRQGYAVGFLLGVGMTAGELPNSFLKRQLDVPPGEKPQGPWKGLFFIFDQVDVIIGVWAFLLFLVRPSVWLILWSILVILVLHVAVSALGYALGMRETIA